MKKSKKLKLWILITLICLVVIVIVAATSVYYFTRQRVFNSRPIVLIHDPLNWEQISLGEGILTHATARAEGGVARVELWVDGEFVTARESPAEGPISPLVLSVRWEPVALGPHVLLVRAISANGVDGQSTITVEAVDAAAIVVEHVLEEGETLESIAEDIGVDVDELKELNPGFGPEGPQEGDLVSYPEAEPAPGETDELAGGDSPPSAAEPPPPGESPPVPRDPAPGSIWDLGDYVLEDIIGLDGPIPFGGTSDEPVTLRVEALSLTTGTAYESVHCYVGMGGSVPQWYPDEDFDLSTDESFASLGGNEWDVAAVLGGDRATSIPWPGNQDLPFEITCVGILGAGTDAVRLGRLELNIRPEHWDGVTRRAQSDGVEGSFKLNYRVTRVELLPIDPMPFIDHTMTPPTNLRIDERTHHLLWDYAPRREPDPEEPIDGFAVYLNDTLQWIMPSNWRATQLPGQWVRAPCGREYEFTVSAFRDPYPAGPESPPSDPLVIEGPEPGSPGCDRRLFVTFDTLTTRDLGGDGDHPRGGHVGPARGTFFANEEFTYFDGSCVGCSRGTVLGLNHNSRYDIMALITDTTRSYDSVVTVDVRPGEYLELGFNIMDDDPEAWGDDQICAGTTLITDIESIGVFSEGSIESDNGRCSVTYTVRPASGHPIGEAEGPPPLPQINATGLGVDETTGALQIHVRNDGTADWSGHDLTIAVERSSGESIGEYTWSGVFIRPGEEIVLYRLDLAPEQPLSVCVHLDPHDEVLEEGERTGAMLHSSRCFPLPDLIITNVVYDSGLGSLLVTVQNVGETALENRWLNLLLERPGSVGIPYPWRTVSIGVRESTVLEWGIPERTRESIRVNGYTLTVDPRDHIAESNEGNNEYVVPAGARLVFEWVMNDLRHYPIRPSDFCDSSGTQQQNIDMSILVHNQDASRRVVASWTKVCDVEGGREPCGVYERVEFEIAGDEKLMVNLSGAVSQDALDEHMGSATAFFEPGDDWGVTRTVEAPEDCSEDWHSRDTQVLRINPPDAAWRTCGDWDARVIICRIAE